MTARELVAALGGRWHGSYGMARCPTHSDSTPSLKVKDKSDGVDLYCFAGCDWRDVKVELRERGLLPEMVTATSTSTQHRRRRRRPPSQAKPKTDDGHNTKLALQIWRAAQPAAGSKAEVYLRARAITLPPPASLRFHRSLTYRSTGTAFPAMVTGVQSPGGKLIAVHRTFLMPDGSAKAPVSSPKMVLGPLGAGAVRLAKAGRVLGLAEGIETGMSAMQLFGTPTWVALGSRLDRVAMPQSVAHVVIFADNGQAGLETATKAVSAFTGQARKVTLRLPPSGYGDWNDVLQAQATERAL